MPSILTFRRGTAAQNDAFTGSAGEITVDNTNGTLRVHDGVTAGGSQLATQSYVSTQLGTLGDLATLNTVGTSQISDGAITSAKLAPGTVDLNNLDASNLTSGTISGDRFAAGHVLQVQANRRTDWYTISTTARTEVLTVQFTPKRSDSAYIITTTLSGQGNDDTEHYVEYQLNNGSWIFDGNTNGNGFRKSLGDHCWSHSSNGGCLSITNTQYFYPGTGISQIGFRLMASAEASFYINQGSSGNQNSYNYDTAMSSIVVMEVSR